MNERFEELYKEGEKRKGKQEKKRDEIEFNKNPEEYTFKPNTHRKKGQDKGKGRATSPPVKPSAPATQRETVSENVASKLVPAARDRS